MLDVGYWIFDPGYSILDLGYGMPAKAAAALGNLKNVAAAFIFLMIILSCDDRINLIVIY